MTTKDYIEQLIKDIEQIIQCHNITVLNVPMTERQFDIAREKLQRIMEPRVEPIMTTNDRSLYYYNVSYNVHRKMSKKEIVSYYDKITRRVEYEKTGTCVHFSIIALNYAELILLKDKFSEIRESITLEHIVLNNWAHEFIKITVQHDLTDKEVFFYDPWSRFHPELSPVDLFVTIDNLKQHVETLKESLDNNPSYAKLHHRTFKIDIYNGEKVDNQNDSLSDHSTIHHIVGSSLRQHKPHFASRVCKSMLFSIVGNTCHEAYKFSQSNQTYKMNCSALFYRILLTTTIILALSFILGRDNTKQSSTALRLT